MLRTFKYHNTPKITMFEEWIAGLVFKFRSSETVSYNAITI